MGRPDLSRSGSEAVPGTRGAGRRVRVFGRVDPPRRCVCHDRGPGRPCGLGASRGARGGGADRVGPPTGWHRLRLLRLLRLLRQIGDELVAGVEQFLLVDNVVAVEDGAALVSGQGICPESCGKRKWRNLAADQANRH